MIYKIFILISRQRCNSFDTAKISVFFFPILYFFHYFLMKELFNILLRQNS